MIDQSALERAIRRNDSTAVAQLYRGAGEADRKATRPLLAALRKEQAEYWRTGRWPGRPFADFALDTAMLATAPSAEGAARVLRWGDHPGRLDVILDREVSWLPALVALLTRVAMSAESGREEVPWEVVDALLARCGLTHLDTPDYALNLLRRQDPRLDAQAQLAVDAALPGILLRALESDRMHDAVVSEWLNAAAKGQERRWAVIAADWAARGVLDRDELHRRLVAALVRGGMQPHLRAVLWILEELVATPAEVEGLLREYLALLDSRQAFVAVHALRAVRRLDAAVPLEAATVVDACVRLLARADASLPQSALTWLGALSRRAPSSADAIARAAAVGLGHPKRAVQEKTLALLTGLGPLGDAAASDVAWALEGVDATVRGADPATVVGRLPELPIAAPVLPLEPIGSPDELVDLVRRVTTIGFEFGDEERLVAGFAAYGSWLQGASRAEVLTERDWLPDLLEELRGGLAETSRGVVSTLKRLAPRHRADARAMVVRAREVATALRAGKATALVAFPRDASGILDPDRLLQNLARAAAENRSIPRVDLEAAWLRLPLGLGDDYRERVAALDGPDAQWLAGELAAGALPAPALRHLYRDHNRRGSYHRFTGEWPGVAGRGGALLRRIGRLDGVTQYVGGEESSTVTLTPTQRELLSAHHLRELSGWEGRGVLVQPLTLLPHQQGAVGQVTHVTLAAGAAQEDAATRAATLDATLGLLAAGDLEGEAAGPHWAELLTSGEYRLTRWTRHLRDVAGSSLAGARYTWGVQRHVLATLLPADTSGRAGVADLVGLAAEAALVTGATGSISGLDEVADRTGRSRIVTEARRLRSVLRGGRPDA